MIGAITTADTPSPLLVSAPYSRCRNDTCACRMVTARRRRARAEVISQQEYFYKRGHYPENQRALSSGEIGPCANARASRAGRLRQPSGLRETGDVLLANRPSGAHSQATDDPVAFKMVGFLFSICTAVLAA
jgi:hypothetical protein